TRPTVIAMPYIHPASMFMTGILAGFLRAHQEAIDPDGDTRYKKALQGRPRARGDRMSNDGKYVRYSESVEVKQPREDEYVKACLEAFERLQKAAFDKHRHAVRGAH